MPPPAATETAMEVTPTLVILSPTAGTKLPAAPKVRAPKASPPVPSVIVDPESVTTALVAVMVPASTVPPDSVHVAPEFPFDIMPEAQLRSPDETVILGAVAPVKDKVPDPVTVAPAMVYVAEAPEKVILLAPAAHVPDVPVNPVGVRLSVSAACCVHVAPGAFNMIVGVRVSVPLLIVFDPRPSNVMLPVPETVIPETSVIEPKYEAACVNASAGVFKIPVQSIAETRKAEASIVIIFDPAVTELLVNFAVS